MTKRLSGEQVWDIIERLAETDEKWKFVHDQLLKGDKVGIEDTLNYRGSFYSDEDAFKNDPEILEFFTELAELIAED